MKTKKKIGRPLKAKHYEFFDGLIINHRDMKASHKLDEDQKKFICRLLGQWESYKDIIRVVRNLFKINLSVQAICWIYQTNRDEVNNARIEHGRKIMAELPIANKSYRLQELRKLYDAAKGKIGLQKSILAAAKAEMGDDARLIAEAIANSGGDVNVNNWIVNLGREELDRTSREYAAILGYQPSSRIAGLAFDPNSN